MKKPLFSDKLRKTRVRKGKQMHIWHNTRGIANEHFIVRDDGYVLFKIPNWLGKWIKAIKIFRYCEHE